MTPSLVALLLLIAAGLVVCSALFSGLETALFALRRHQLRRLESNYPALAGFVQKFRENPRRVLAVILLGFRAGECFSHRHLSGFALGNAARHPVTAMADCRFALRHHRFLLRFNSQACRAFRALPPFYARRLHFAGANAIARNRR